MDNSETPSTGALSGESIPARIPLIVVLDDVRSMHNVGSIFRTADAVGLEAVWLLGITGQPPHRDIRKTALGAESTVPWRYFSQREEALAELRSRNTQVWALEQAPGSMLLDRFQPRTGEAAALWLGHEVRGVEQAILDQSDAILEIPQYGTKNSFNVSVAAGIALHALGQVMRQTTRG